MAKSPEDLRKFLVQTFPALDPGIAVEVVDLYQRAGMWTTPRIDPAAYDRWQAGIRGEHLIDSPIPYGTLIDPAPAEGGGGTDLMRIAVTNPNTSATITAGLVEAAKRAALPDAEIVVGGSTEGPEAIEGPFDGALMLQAMQLAELEGADAHVIACFDDTSLDAARAALARPVVGIGEAAMHIASLVTSRFTIVTTLSRSVPILRDNVRRHGFETRCTDVLASDIPVLALHDPASGAEAAISRQIRVARAGGAEGIVLGCAGMACFARRLEDEHGVPVIEGVCAAVALAAALVRTGTATSRAGLWARPTRLAALERCPAGPSRGALVDRG